VDTVSGDVEVEEADEGDLIGDEYAEDVEEEVIPESEWGGHATGQGNEELNARIDALMDEIKAGMQDQAEPPDSAGGGESGGSQAGIIDGDESGSVREDF
jgi:hypothetical protein